MARIAPPSRQPLLGKLLNWVIVKRYGKPFASVALLGHNPSYPFAYMVVSSVFSMGKTKLPKETKRLVTQLVAELNSCAFCIDLGQRLAQDEQLSFEKLQRVLDFEHQPAFSPAERAALRFALEATELGAKVSDETFNEVKTYFDEREILELTVAVATENFYNRMTGPLELASQGFCDLPVSQKQTQTNKSASALSKSSSSKI